MIAAWPAVGVFAEAQEVVISEFLAVNSQGLRDDDGEPSDWIELFNPGSEPVSLQGYFLTDDRGNPGKWILPALQIPADGYALIFASGKDRTSFSGPTHTNFRLEREGEYLALIAPDAKRVVHAFAPAYPEQTADRSYGLSTDLETGYLLQPTPGTANGVIERESIDAPVSSVPHGLYGAPFRAELVSLREDDAILYTLDGSAPTPETGLVYEGPVVISETTVLRARVLRDSATSVTRSYTYIFPDDVGLQEEMDARIVSDPQAASMEEALAGLPVVSLTTGEELLFGEDGIYNRPLERGDTAEVPVSFELFNSRQRPDIHFSAGLRIHGGAARRHVKKPLRLHFREAYGSEWLDKPLFPGSSVERFRTLVLRSEGHDAWSEPGGNDQTTLAYHATYMRDAMVRQNDLAMGLLAARGFFVQVFLNGKYWGLYNLQEQPGPEFFSDHAGGDAEDWDVIKQGSFFAPDGSIPAEVAHGDATAWDELQTLTSRGIRSRVQYEEILRFIDVDRFADALISRMWAGDHDWLGPVFIRNFASLPVSNNWFMARNSRGAEDSPFLLLTWDAEISLGSNLFLGSPKRSLDFNLMRISVKDSPAVPYDALRRFPDFQIRFADRLQKHLSDGGVLSPVQTQRRWRELRDSLRKAVWAESARWGDTAGDDPLNPIDHWEPEVEWVHDTFLTERNEIFLSHASRIGLFPIPDPPEVEPPGGITNEGAEVTLGPGRAFSDMYYTIDGTDPRNELTNQPSGSAMVYQSSFTVEENLTVKARRRDFFGDWSALTEAEFFVGFLPAHLSNVVMTELLPAPAEVSDLEANRSFETEDFEWIEFLNTSAFPIDLGGLSFTHGIRFVFPEDSVVPAGERLVLAREPAAFRLRYPGSGDLQVAGPYSGKLKNEGERVRLVSPAESIIADITYTDGLPWAPYRSQGRSLVLAPTAFDTPREITGPEAWRLSASPGGTPGGTDTLGYASWLTGSFTDQEIAAGFITLPLADPDEDGLSNLEEYVFAGDPRQPDAAEFFPLRLRVEEAPFGYRTLPYVVLQTAVLAVADDAEVVIEESENLRDWFPADVSVVEKKPGPRDTIQTSWRAALPVTAFADAKVAYRIRVRLMDR